MIDMVVHRHKLRETLSRICRMLMGVQPVRHTDKTKLNGKSHSNGSSIDTNLIGSRNGSTQTIEPEILGPEERFDTARIEHRDITLGDDAPPVTRSPKDRQH
jgi:acetyl-CoA carboxylase carboxyl transferase subunit beta